MKTELEIRVLLQSAIMTATAMKLNGKHGPAADNLMMAVGTIGFILEEPDTPGYEATRGLFTRMVSVCGIGTKHAE